MAVNWREAIKELIPGWMTAERFWGSLTGYWGAVLDANSQAAIEALYAPWLAEPTSPDDVLPYIASERMMQQFPGETADQHRARLLDAWNAWTYASNESAIRGQLELFGLSDIEFFRARDWDWDSLAPGPATWVEGVGGEDNWSRVWVVISGHPWAVSNDLDDDSHVLGMTATHEEIRTVRGIIQQWKGAEGIVPWIIFVMDSGTWASEQPDGTWYDVRNRSQAAVYVDGVGQRPVLLP